MNRLGYVCLCVGMASNLFGAGDLNWPQFRGPRGDGTTLADALPLHWGENQNVSWKTAIHGRAWCSPVLWNHQIWLTTATENGRELSVLCLDAETGRIMRDLKVFEVEKPQYSHSFNTYASPTSVIEEGRVYVSFGAPGLACLDTATGRKIWERRDFVCNHYRGAGSSPILWGNLLLLNFDGSDHQFVVALDKATGRTVWEKPRSIDFKDLGPDGLPMMEGDLRKGFATCHVLSLDGRPTLLSQGSKALYAYDPLTGEERWRVEERSNHSASTRPVAGLGLIFVPSGWASGQLLAIRPGRQGEVIDANAPASSSNQLQVVWKTKRNVPKKPSLLLLDDLLYGLDDIGLITCWEARTGQVVWNERVGGNYSASLLATPGRIYLLSEEGKTIVVQTGREFKKLAENQLDGGFMASPAVEGNALILRTKTHLYRIEQKAGAQ
jgi:outer membrane protein assembly factor BamB